jgi:hypothetical protein
MTHEGCREPSSFDLNGVGATLTAYSRQAHDRKKFFGSPPIAQLQELWTVAPTIGSISNGRIYSAQCYSSVSFAQRRVTAARAGIWMTLAVMSLALAGCGASRAAGRSVRMLGAGTGTAFLSNLQRKMRMRMVTVIVLTALVVTIFPATS